MAAREVVPVRLGGMGLELVEKMVVETETDRSKVVRELLAEALKDKALVARAVKQLIAKRETI